VLIDVTASFLWKLIMNVTCQPSRPTACCLTPSQYNHTPTHCYLSFCHSDWTFRFVRGVFAIACEKLTFSQIVTLLSEAVHDNSSSPHWELHDLPCFHSSCFNNVYCRVTRLAFFRSNFRNLAWFQVGRLKTFSWRLAFLASSQVGWP